MNNPQVDYSLYLVTDSTEAILGKRDLLQVVQQALEGGKYRFYFSYVTDLHTQIFNAQS